MALHEVLAQSHAHERQEKRDPQRPVARAAPVDADGHAAVMHEDDEDGYRRDHLHDADKAVEVHEAGVIARAVEDELCRAEYKKKEAHGVPVARFAPAHGEAAPREVKPHQHERRREHHQKLHKKRGEAVVRRAVDVDGRCEGQVLQRRRLHGDLAAAGVVEHRRQPDERHGERRARGNSVHHARHIVRKAQPPDEKRREERAQQRARQAVPAAGIVRQRAPQPRVLLGVAVPVDNAAQRHGEEHRQRQKHPQCLAGADIRGVQRIAEREARRHAQRDDDTAPIDDGAAGVYGYSVHPDTSDSGIAVAK